MVTFPPSPSPPNSLGLAEPPLPRLRAASSAPPAQDKARPSGPEWPPPPPSPSSPAEAGGPRREASKGLGAHASPGAAARRREPPQGGHSREAVAGDAGGAVGAGRLSRSPRPATQPAPPQTKIRRPARGPSAPSLSARYAASRARPAPAPDFIGGPGGRSPRPPPAAAPPLPGRARGRGARAPGRPRRPTGHAERWRLCFPFLPRRPAVWQQRDRDNFLQVQSGALPGSEGLMRAAPLPEPPRSRV